MWPNAPINVRAGNIVNVGPLGDRSQAFSLVKPEDILGFDDATMVLVVPKTPYKPHTTEHWPDIGVHATIYESDEVTEDMKQVVPANMDVAVMADNIILLPGREKNDEACELVFYVALALDEKTTLEAKRIRSDLLRVVDKEEHVFHVSVAGIGPKDGDYVAFRQKYEITNDRKAIILK